VLAFTFPGQGSQKHGMGLPWQDHPSWELVEEASQVLDRDLGDLLINASDEELTHTRNAQIATFVMSLVVLDAVERVGVVAGLAAGHSLGEYTALTATGALSYDDGVRLVSERGEAMQMAAQSQAGTMAAILGLEDERVAAACASVDDDVWVANFNAPGQVVIAGSRSGVEAASSAAKDFGAKRALPLPVGGAFHTPYMEPARERLRKALRETEIRSPAIPIVANVDAVAHASNANWQGTLSAQLCSPVRWRQSLETLQSAGASTLIELGPGAVLTGMAKRTVKTLNRFTVNSPEHVDKLLEALTKEADIAQPTKVAPNRQDEGEHLFVHERLVVSSVAGIFSVADDLAVGQIVSVGDLVGTVGESEVRSPFAGSVMGVMAIDGERVTPSQPIAWLRTV
jgi:[acyl-carrier-protein] S-malonyltransferase